MALLLDGFHELERPAPGALRRSAGDEAIGVGRAVFVLCVLLAGMMNSCRPGPRGAGGAGCQLRNDSTRGMKTAWSWNRKAWPASG